MDAAGQRSSKVSSVPPEPAPAVSRIQERGYFYGYTWAEVFWVDPLVLALTALGLFFLWYSWHHVKLEHISAQDVVAWLLLFCAVVHYESMLHLAFCCNLGNPPTTTPSAATTGGGGGGRRTATTAPPSRPPAPARIVVDAAAQPVVSVFCNPCGAYLSLKWCMGLDKYVIGCSCPRDVVVERCTDSSGQRQLRICIPIG